MNSCVKLFSLLFCSTLGWVARGRALGLPVLVLLVAALQAAPARADVWGYVNTQGTAHFSATQLDERYELFSRGGESFGAGQGERPGEGSAYRAAGVATAPPKLLAYFEVSPHYKAVKHLLREASLTHGIDYELLQALIATESGFNTQAVSPKGARGLMQLMPTTAAAYGMRDIQELHDPEKNLDIGIRHLKSLLATHRGQWALALASYNAGQGAVAKHGQRIPGYTETMLYVPAILAKAVRPGTQDPSISLSQNIAE
jgi:soluble lytic murein transglycosylase-like protein